MNWKKEFAGIESTFGRHEERDWKPVIELVYELIPKYADDVEFNVRVIYLIHNILLEEITDDHEHHKLKPLLPYVFKSSHERFSENPEYLFFVGKILYIAEWYFELNDDDKPIEKRLAFQMQKRASEIEPDNLLFEWACAFSLGESRKAFALADQILNGDGEWISWLKSKGFPGNYVLVALESTYENYNEIDK